MCMMCVCVCGYMCVCVCVYMCVCVCTCVCVCVWVHACAYGGWVGACRCMVGGGCLWVLVGSCGCMWVWGWLMVASPLDMLPTYRRNLRFFSYVDARSTREAAHDPAYMTTTGEVRGVVRRAKWAPPPQSHPPPTTPMLHPPPPQPLDTHAYTMHCMHCQVISTHD